MGRTPSTDELVPELTFDEIDRAFDNNEFCFYLQPKCNAATGAIVGAEALVRWNHPKYGVVSPGRFVPMLEQAGQISRLDVFVWRSVVRMLARWEREGRNLVPISVNVSMVDIDQMDVADTLTGLLNEYDVDARLLQAEITESAVARNLSKVESTIRKLHADNIAVLMDDFGSAYSSLNMLKEVPVDVLKLDMRFLYGLEDGDRGGSILQSMVGMAGQLRLEVIAEGVETEEQARFLAGIGCKLAQGYYYDRPMPEAQFLTRLAQQPNREDLYAISAAEGLEQLLCSAVICEREGGTIRILHANTYYLRMMRSQPDAPDADEKELNHWIGNEDGRVLAATMDAAREMNIVCECVYLQRDLGDQYHLLRASLRFLSAEGNKELYMMTCAEEKPHG